MPGDGCEALAGDVMPSSNSTPSRRRRKLPELTVPATSAKYSFSTP